MTDPTPINLNGAVVAITGGARGIGLCTAKDFTKLGATVVIGDLDEAATDAAAESIGPKARGFQLDVTDAESFTRFVETIEEEVGPIDVFVNNAGIMPAGPFLDEADKTSDTQIDVNLRGPIKGMKLVLPLMLGRDKGHLINVASMAGKAPIPGLAVYNSTKFAVVGLSEAVRDEIEDTGVTITTIMPNAVKTELTMGLPTEKVGALTPEKVSKAIVASVKHRRPEVAVPRWFGAYPLLAAALPRSVMTWMRHKLGAYRLLDESRIDKATREQYDERIADSSSRDKKDSLVG
jgi:NAD(P)-dependent dehydrogenase (short-subunit alcohol dehydrogenase family)